MRTSLFITAILALGTPGLGAERVYDPNVDTWSVLALPPGGAWQLYTDCFTRNIDHLKRKNDLMPHMQFLRETWVVRQENGKVVAHLVQDHRPQSSETPDFDTTLELPQFKRSVPLFAKVDNGWIAAYDAGEFGGAVYWFNATGTKKRRLSRHHIHQFLADGERLFAVEGLNHFVSRGSMVELRKQDGKWVCEKFVTLPQTGEVIAKMAPGEYVIATSDMLVRVNVKKELKVLVPERAWFGASSIAIAGDGHVYVGTRLFVARYKVAETVQAVEYLVPDENWLKTDE